MIQPRNGRARRRVLVSGCRGFLGSWLVRLLRAPEACVIGMAFSGRIEAGPCTIPDIPVSAVRGIWNLLEAIRTMAPTTKLVLHSTDSVYGENDGKFCWVPVRSARFPSSVLRLNGHTRC